MVFPFGFFDYESAQGIDDPAPHGVVCIDVNNNSLQGWHRRDLMELTKKVQHECEYYLTVVWTLRTRS
jgi:hypothetical protein